MNSKNNKLKKYPIQNTYWNYNTQTITIFNKNIEENNPLDCEIIKTITFNQARQYIEIPKKWYDK